MRLAASLFRCLALGAACVQLHAQGNVPPPYSEVNGSVVISGFHTLGKPSSPEGIFLNALLWTIENREPADTDAGKGGHGIETDYDRRQFRLESVLASPRSTSRYRCRLSVKVTDNIITILASDITCEAETGVIKLVKRLPFEKLQPGKKPKHKEHLDEFAKLHKETVGRMLEAIAASPAPALTHWTEIKDRQVVKGMSKQECLLSFGKPASVQRQGSREEWMYDSYTYVFLENDTVTSLIK